MPRTRSDLITRALGLLGIIQAGQDPSAEDVELVDGYIDGKREEIARRRVLYIQNIDAIDDEYFLPFARIIANAVAPEFGQPRDPGVDLDAERTLREMQREPGVSETVRAVYF